MIEATYRYDRAVARDAFFRLLWRFSGGALLGAALALAWVVWTARMAETRWLSGLVAGLVLAYVLLLLRSYRSAMAVAEVHAAAPITLRMTPEAIAFESVLGSSTSPWTAVSGVFAASGYVVLRRKGTPSAVTIPAGSLTPEALAFLLERAREAGARVVRRG